MKLDEIRAWQKAKEFAVEIYRLDFDNSDLQQIIREVSLQISINIAKGFEKSSSQEFLKFLHLAQESCSAVKNLIYVAYDLNFLSDTDRDRLFELSEETTKLTGGFIKHLKTKLATPTE